MSIRAMSDVWENSKQKGNALLLLLALADFADDLGRSYPSVDRLAHKTRMSRRNVQTLARQLVTEGELRIKENAGRNGCNVYELLGVQSLHGCKDAPESGIAPGAESRPAFASEPSGTVTRKPSGTKTGAAKESDPRLEEFKKLWSDHYKEKFGRAALFSKKDDEHIRDMLKITEMTAPELIVVAVLAWQKKGQKFWSCERSRAVDFFARYLTRIMSELDGELKAKADDDHEARYGFPRGTIPLSQRPPPGEDEVGNKISAAEYEERFPLTLYNHDA